MSATGFHPIFLPLKPLCNEFKAALVMQGFSASLPRQKTSSASRF